jgi:hypothetical protein
VASSGGSILERIFQVFAHSARLTLLHLPGGLIWSLGLAGHAVTVDNLLITGA